MDGEVLHLRGHPRIKVQYGNVKRRILGRHLVVRGNVKIFRVGERQVEVALFGSVEAREGNLGGGVGRTGPYEGHGGLEMDILSGAYDLPVNDVQLAAGPGRCRGERKLTVLGECV